LAAFIEIPETKTLVETEDGIMLFAIDSALIVREIAADRVDDDAPLHATEAQRLSVKWIERNFVEVIRS
jgi:hypothetical protein